MATSQEEKVGCISNSEISYSLSLFFFPPCYFRMSTTTPTKKRLRSEEARRRRNQKKKDRSWEDSSERPYLLPTLCVPRVRYDYVAIDCEKIVVETRTPSEKERVASVGIVDKNSVLCMTCSYLRLVIVVSTRSLDHTAL